VRSLIRTILLSIPEAATVPPDRDAATAQEVIREIRVRFRGVLRVRFVRSDYPPPDPNAVYDGSDGRVF
jgi:hypothetical protein